MIRFIIPALSLLIACNTGDQPKGTKTITNTVTNAVTNTVTETVTIEVPVEDTDLPTDTELDTGTPSVDTGDTGEPVFDPDNDLDGWTVSQGDCDDSEVDTFPGAAELEDAVACMNDDDDDGWGDDGHIRDTVPPGVTLGTDCEDGWYGTYPDAPLVGDWGDVCDELTSDHNCNGLIDNTEAVCDGLVCTFPTDVIDAYGVVTNVVLSNELWFTLSLLSPSGAQVPGFGEVIRFNVANYHPDCPDVQVNEIAFEVTSTDNALSDWDLGMMAAEAKVKDLSSGTVVMGPLFAWDSYDLLFWDAFTVTAGETLTLSLEIDTTGASTALDDSVLAEIKANSIVIEIEGVEYFLANDSITGGTLIY